MPENALDILNTAILRLHSAGIDEAELDAKYIVSHVLGVPAYTLYTEKARTVNRRQKSVIDRMLKQRTAGKPLQYVIKEQAFFGLTFKVTPHVLIPRPETELLVEKALKKARELTSPDILDLCTGSGCIAVSLKANLPGARITASDISAGALRTAKSNAKLNRTDIRFVRSDLFSRLTATFDIIVTNPPYINQKDYQALDKKILDHEPKTALLGGEDGLTVIRIIIAEAITHLRPNGWLLMEIGYDQRESVEALMKKEGCLDIHTFQDYSGFDRIVIGRRI